MKTKNYGIYILSLMILGAPYANARCHWDNEAAANEEGVQHNAIVANQARRVGLVAQQTSNKQALTVAAANQVQTNKNNNNINNLVSRLQMAVQGLVSLGQVFAADEKGRLALAALVNSVTSEDWITDVKAQIDEINASESLRESTKEILSAFSGATTDARVRVQDASLALQTALSAADPAGAQVGLEITRRTAVVRIKDASAISQDSGTALTNANTALEQATTASRQSDLAIATVDQDIQNELAAYQRANAAKGEFTCPEPPLPRHAPF